MAEGQAGILFSPVMITDRAPLYAHLSAGYKWKRLKRLFEKRIDTPKTGGLQILPFED